MSYCWCIITSHRNTFAWHPFSFHSKRMIHFHRLLLIVHTIHWMRVHRCTAFIRINHKKRTQNNKFAGEAHVLFEFVKCELYIYFVWSSISLHQQRKSNALLSKQIAIGRANIFDDSQCAWPSTPIRRQFNSVLSLCFVCSGKHMHATADNKCHFNLDKSNKVGANVIRTLKHEQTNHTLWDTETTTNPICLCYISFFFSWHLFIVSEMVWFLSITESHIRSHCGAHSYCVLICCSNDLLKISYRTFLLCFTWFFFSPHRIVKSHFTEGLISQLICWQVCAFSTCLEWLSDSVWKSLVESVACTQNG